MTAIPALSTNLVRCNRRAVATVLRLFLAVMPMAGAGASPIVIDFESVPPRDTSLGTDFWVGNPGFVAGSATFSGGNFYGYVVSASTITGTGGYFYDQAFGAASAAAEISAEANAGAGGGVGGGQFAVLSDAVSFGFGPSPINLPAGYRPASVHVTNVATTAWLLAHPDPNKIATPMSQNGQEFSVTFRGWSQAGAQGTQLGSATFVLGSYAESAASIVKDWMLIDLASLGNAASIDVMFASYDEGEFGINTPTYVALDNLTLVAVPEPTTWAILASGVIVASAGRRWRRRGSGDPAVE